MSSLLTYKILLTIIALCVATICVCRLAENHYNGRGEPEWVAVTGGSAIIVMAVSILVLVLTGIWL